MNNKELLEEARKRFEQCVEEDSENREKMKDDLRFCTLDQWDENIRKSRENDPNGSRPCLTIDKINQYIVQVVNDMRQNRPSVKVRPIDDFSDVETAKVLQGLVRHIEDRSNASIAYETAGENQVKMGRGYFRIITEYIEGSFDQEILIKRIPDAFSVYLGPHIMPDGSDAEYGFVAEKIPKADFKRQYPKASTNPEDFEEFGDDWTDSDSVTVVEYFYTEKTDAKLLFLADGTSVYSDEYDGAEENIVKSRSTVKSSIKWVKMTGADVLEERDWAGKYIPIIEVVGRESVVDGKHVLWGLVRPAKDNLRMYNYWASAITEKIGLSPKTPFVGAKGQFEGLENKWRLANRDNFAYLEYNAIDVNGNAIPPPQRVQPAAMEMAMVNMMGMIENDVRASLGMYKASVGDASSQQSGRALLALQRESDTGTSHFSDNLAYAICHCGRILVDLIPKIMDTRRIIRILGEDGEIQNAIIDPQQQESVRKVTVGGNIHNIYNLGVGEFDVTVTIGPSYNTKRMEAAQVFSEMARGATEPASAAVLHYLTVKNSDFTSSDEAIKMLKSLLPPQALDAMKQEGGAIPPQAMLQMQQMQQQGQEMQQQIQELSGKLQQADSGIAKAQMDSQTKLQIAQQDNMLQAATTEEKLKVEMQTEVIKAQTQREIAEMEAMLQQETELKKAALQAATQIEIARANACSQANQQAEMENAENSEQAFMAKILETQEQLLASFAAPKPPVTVQRDENGNVVRLVPEHQYMQ